MSATEQAKKTHADFVLPPNVVTKTDLSRLVNEFEQLDNDLTAVAVRAKAGAGAQEKPVLSDALKDFLVQNKLAHELESSSGRSGLVKQLRLFKDKAPVVHMTFAVKADHASLAELVTWLRQSVHPQTVITVGLQPGLVAGVYMRTPNHVHDMSLRAALKNSHGLLVKQLEALHG